MNMLYKQEYHQYYGAKQRYKLVGWFLQMQVYQNHGCRMARKKQVFSDKGMSVKNAGTWVNKRHQPNWWVKLNQADGNKTGYTNKVQCPDITDAYPWVIQSPPHHEQTHTPNKYENRYRKIIRWQMGQYPIVQHNAICTAFNVLEKGGQQVDDSNYDNSGAQ